jgi:hypothetical protein
MKTNLSLLVFLVAEIAVVAFILVTAGALPELVASHFGGAGVPNALMTKTAYLVFMLVFSAGLPAFVIGFTALALRIAPGSFHFPNRKLWLSPQYREETIRYLDARTPWLGSLLCLFMGYVHWTIVNANSVLPVQLPVTRLFGGLVVFLALVLLWCTLVLMKFSRIPKA